MVSASTAFTPFRRVDKNRKHDNDGEAIVPNDYRFGAGQRARENAGVRCRPPVTAARPDRS